MKKVNVKITFTESVLGTSPTNPNIYTDFIGSKAPDAATVEEEVAALGVDAVAEKGTTVFPRTEDGEPFFYDYQIKGFFKGACGFLWRVPGTISKSMKAYKKVIDGNIFVHPRKITIHTDEQIGILQRPLRAQTMQGERVTLASSEEIQPGAWCEFTVTLLNDADEKALQEWLDFGQLNGIGQWRNASHGRFTWEAVE